jgi:hypothetical protein
VAYCRVTPPAREWSRCSRVYAMADRRVDWWLCLARAAGMRRSHRDRMFSNQTARAGACRSSAEGAVSHKARHSELGQSTERGGTAWHSSARRGTARRASTARGPLERRSRRKGLQSDAAAVQRRSAGSLTLLCWRLRSPSRSGCKREPRPFHPHVRARGPSQQQRPGLALVP